LRQRPALIADVGPEATKRFFEFFTVPIRNKNTRIAYYHAIGQFLTALSLRSHSINHPDWIFETKLYGYRAIAVIDPAGKGRIWSRNRLPLEQKFPTVRGRHRKIPIL
jgi:ATP-dependent DNA ligase